MSLYLRDTSLTTEDLFTKKVNDVENGQGIAGVGDYKNNIKPYAADRTAIGYSGNGATIYLASAVNVKPYELRAIMQSLGCFDAIMLDGADLSQLEGKSRTGSNIIANGYTSNVWHMVTVRPDSWT